MTVSSHNYQPYKADTLAPNSFFMLNNETIAGTDSQSVHN